MLETILAISPATYAAFLGTAVLLMASPGPDLMFTLATGMSGGPRSGVAAGMGITLGVMVHALLAAIGVAALLAAAPAALSAVRWIGAGYLLVLAWKSWTASGSPMRGSGSGDVGRAFRQGLVTNLFNPKAILFSLALLPQFADPALGAIGNQIFIFGALLAGCVLVTYSLIGLFAGLVAGRIRRSAGILNKLAAVVFGGLALRLIWE